MNEKTEGGFANFAIETDPVPKAESIIEDIKHNTRNALNRVDQLYDVITQQEFEISTLRLRLDDIKENLEKALENIYVDPLTNCLNYNFYENYKVENFNPDGDRNRIALVYIDLNDLKTINDTIGHQAGNQYIVDTAEFLKSKFRTEDIVIRLHGDEFVIICRDRKDGIDDAKLRARVTEITEQALSSDKNLNFAAGIAVFDNESHDGKVDEKLDDTEARAEKEMYLVKLQMKRGWEERDPVTFREPVLNL